MSGYVFRRCGCQNPDTGKQYGTKCQKRKSKDHGTWWGRYDLPPGSKGERRQERIGPFSTKDDAESGLREAMGQVADGAAAGQCRDLFGDYLEEWVAGRRTLSATTLRGYRSHIRLYLKPGLGHVRMCDLRDRHFEELFEAMRQIGRLAEGARPSPILRRLLEARPAPNNSKRSHSAATARHVHTTAKSALNDAIRKKKLRHNPAKYVELPKPRKRRPLVWTDARVRTWLETGKKPAKVMVWTPAQTGNFLDFVLDDDHYALWHLICYKPLRRSEVAGIAEHDFDPRVGQLLILDTHTGVEQEADDWGDEDWDDTKSDTSQRSLALDTVSNEVLALHVRRQQHRRGELDDAWAGSGRLFTGPTGAALDPEWISQKFERFLTRHATIRRRFLQDEWTRERIRNTHKVTDRAIDVALAMPLPPIRLHDTRHGAASLMLAAGCDITIVKEECGHATAAFTRDTYQHVYPELARHAANQTASIVPRNAKTPKRMHEHVPTTCSPTDKTDTNPDPVMSVTAGQTWWGGWGSNPRPTGYESAALTS
ncbi:integrase-like protein [Stackebrandtia albiflava]|uniref:Integrase-like protein n=1 Tax=Stackebrandtia albiflava TaxID=406432 RepID=A0A562UQ07_9ACTN|nr:integrase-like protein [Stackebrandtia albiflava]